MKLSIIIPAYNEEKTIHLLLEKVLKVKSDIVQFEKEIIIVNDCSKDKTLEVIQDISKLNPEIKIISNEINLGKSQTVKNGILISTGDWVVIQDADLEYEPADFVFMLEQVIRLNCDVAYGNRFGIDNGIGYIKNFIGNVGLSLISNLFTMVRTRVYIPDMEVCYKMVKGELMRKVCKDIESKSNFGFEPEVTARLTKYKKDNGENLKFVILPIHYYPRTVEEGKKMHAMKDGFKALIEILKYNLF
jgi:glycosyltransferase involved in cell wall biosynthesis